MDRKKALKNWWYYNKWYVLGGCIIAGIMVNLIGSYFHLWSPIPDYQVAYIGAQLPENTAAALEEAFESISPDMNGDGKVVVQINQYLSRKAAEASGASEALLAAEVSLNADIEECESYFFLTEDPDQFQREYHVLANPDGSCPADTDDAVDDKALSWTDTSFSSKDLGMYTYTALGQVINGNSDEWMQDFYIGRRCFYSDKTTENIENIEDLETVWNTIKEK